MCETPWLDDVCAKLTWVERWACRESDYCTEFQVGVQLRKNNLPEQGNVLRQA